MEHQDILSQSFERERKLREILKELKSATAKEKNNYENLHNNLIATGKEITQAWEMEKRALEDVVDELRQQLVEKEEAISKLKKQLEDKMQKKWDSRPQNVAPELLHHLGKLKRESQTAEAQDEMAGENEIKLELVDHKIHPRQPEIHEDEAEDQENQLINEPEGRENCRLEPPYWCPWRRDASVVALIGVLVGVALTGIGMFLKIKHNATGWSTVFHILGALFFIVFVNLLAYVLTLPRSHQGP